MPGPWRRRSVLNRTHCADISISDEMPGPWRPWSDVFLTFDVWSFQSQTRCQAPGDHEHDRYAEHDHKISISDEMQAPGDLNIRSLVVSARDISISDEMPGPWRPLL